MAYKIIDRVYNAYTDDYRLTIIADTDEDVLDLPLASVGSTVIVADRGNEYIANSKGGWVFKSGDESRAVKYEIRDPEIEGTWYFHDVPPLSEDVEFIFDFGTSYEFEGNTSFSGLRASRGGGIDFLIAETYDWGIEYREVKAFYGEGDDWWMSEGSPVTMFIVKYPGSDNKALLAWLQENATKIT